jgi:hypothetical protein
MKLNKLILKQLIREEIEKMEMEDEMDMEDEFDDPNPGKDAAESAIMAAFSMNKDLPVDEIAKIAVDNLMKNFDITLKPEAREEMSPEEYERLKLTESRLKRIIKEELNKALNERIRSKPRDEDPIQSGESIKDYLARTRRAADRAPMRPGESIDDFRARTRRAARDPDVPNPNPSAVSKTAIAKHKAAAAARKVAGTAPDALRDIGDAALRGSKKALGRLQQLAKTNANAKAILDAVYEENPSLKPQRKLTGLSATDLQFIEDN